MANFHYQIMFILIAGVASGATRAALTQHFALQNNAADISAKVLVLLFQMDLNIPKSLILPVFLLDRKEAKRQLQR